MELSVSDYINISKSSSTWISSFWIKTFRLRQEFGYFSVRQIHFAVFFFNGIHFRRSGFDLTLFSPAYVGLVLFRLDWCYLKFDRLMRTPSSGWNVGLEMLVLEANRCWPHSGKNRSHTRGRFRFKISKCLPAPNVPHFVQCVLRYSSSNWNCCRWYVLLQIENRCHSSLDMRQDSQISKKGHLKKEVFLFFERYLFQLTPECSIFTPKWVVTIFTYILKYNEINGLLLDWKSYLTYDFKVVLNFLKIILRKFLLSIHIINLKKPKKHIPSLFFKTLWLKFFLLLFEKKNWERGQNQTNVHRALDSHWITISSIEVLQRPYFSHFSSKQGFSWCNSWSFEADVFKAGLESRI